VSALAEIRVRDASAGDAPILARHRVDMFRDMGTLDGAGYESLRAASESYFERAIASGEYLAWLACATVNGTEEIAGGAGLQLRPMLPRPARDRRGLVFGPEGLILNVYIERAWRRRGIATLLMERVMDVARARGIKRLSLHASAEGRPLYEQLGWTPSNEMRMPGSE